MSCQDKYSYHYVVKVSNDRQSQMADGGLSGLGPKFHPDDQLDNQLENVTINYYYKVNGDFGTLNLCNSHSGSTY